MTEPQQAFFGCSCQVDPDWTSVDTHPDSPPTSRVESGWKLPQPGNRSLLRSNAPLSGNSNNLSLFWSPDLIRLEVTPTTHPHSLRSSQTTVMELQQSTRCVYTLPLRSDGTSTINRRILRSTAPIGWNNNNRSKCYYVQSLDSKWNNIDSFGVPSAKTS